MMTREQLAEDFLQRINRGARLRGFVRIQAVKRGRVLWEVERENTVVDGMLPLVAALIGGSGTLVAQSITAIGFGSGSSDPDHTQSDITVPAYYKALPAATFPTPGYVQWAWTLAGGGADAAAVGINVQELGLYANTGAVGLPLARPSGAAPAMTMCARLKYALGIIAAINYNSTWTINA